MSDPGPSSALKRKREDGPSSSSSSTDGEPPSSVRKVTALLSSLHSIRLLGIGDKTRAGSDLAEVVFRGEQHKQEFVIGRHQSATLIIRDINVSRRHAVVRLDADNSTWSVEDQKSLNGVHVNGAALPPFQERVLEKGDTVSLSPQEEYVWKVEETTVIKPQSEKEEEDQVSVESVEKMDFPKTVDEEQEEEEKEKEEDDTPSTSKCKNGALAAEVSEEFCCSVCGDVFIEPRSLQCGHVFCQFCLLQWKAKTTTKQVCPICREPFRGDGHRNYVLESLISAWEQKLGEDDAGQRRDAVEERKENMEKFDKKKNAAVAGPSTVDNATPRQQAGFFAAFFRRQEPEDGAGAARARGATRGRGRPRGSRGARGGGAASSSSSAPGAARGTRGARARGRGRGGVNDREADNGEGEVEREDEEGESSTAATASQEANGDSTSESSSSVTILDSQANDTDDDDSDASVEGIPGFFYGGYGECFNCGRRGHWAPGCPLN